MQKSFQSKIQEIDKIASFFSNCITEDFQEIFTGIKSFLTITDDKLLPMSVFFKQNYNLLEKASPSFVDYLFNQLTLLPDELLEEISSYLSVNDLMEIFNKYAVEYEESADDNSVYNRVNKVQKIGGAVDVYSNIGSQHTGIELNTTTIGDFGNLYNDEL